MNKNINLQDVFLNQARKERIGVTIFLTNGFRDPGMRRQAESGLQARHFNDHSDSPHLDSGSGRRVIEI